MRVQTLLLTTVLAAATALPAFADDAPKGIQYGAVWTSDLTGNVSGGLRRGGLMMHNLDMTADWQNDKGWEAFGYVLDDFNGGLSSKYVGDAQVTSNIDATPGLRLFEAWVRKTSADQSLITTFGLINLNGIFDVQDNGSLFLNASHGIGPDYSQSGPSIFPISSLGAVAEWHANDHFTLRGAVFDAIPGDAQDDTRFVYIRLSGDEGAHLVAEAQYDFKGGRIKLGHWANTLAAPTLDGTSTHRASGTYGQLQLTLSHEREHPDQGLKTWLRVGVADDRTLAIDRYTGGGLVYDGLLPGRDDDSAGIAVATAHFGAPFRSLTGPLDSETTWEVSYRAAIRPGLSLQPDVQYVVHPSGDPSIRNALVVGVRLKLDLLAK